MTSPAPAPTPPAVVNPFAPPAAVRPVRATLHGKMIWLYGEPKIGKTTFSARLGNTWFIGTEKGQDFVECREPLQINDWKTFKSFVEYLYKNKPSTFGDGAKIEWLCIDTVDKLFRFCSDAVCKEMGIDDPGEMGHGKAWSKLRTEFHRVMNVLRSLPYGLICISHQTEREATIRGQTIKRVQPNVGASGYDWLLGASDLIVHAFATDVPVKDATGKITGQWQNVRAIRLHPSANVVAGGRMSQYLPQTLPLDASKLIEVVDAADETITNNTVDSATVNPNAAAAVPATEPQQ